MRRFAAAIVLGVLVALPAAAQDETRRELAERAVAAGYEADIAGRIMDVFWPVALEIIRSRVPDVTDLQLFQYRGKTAIFAAEAAHDGLAPLVDLYEQGFTADELRVIAEFYESPAGGKLASAQGQIASVLSGAAGTSLTAAVSAMTGRVGELLAADGY